MHKRFAVIALLALPSTTIAQAPIVREPPATVVRYADWPQPSSIRENTRLLVATFDGVSHDCRFRSLEPSRLNCRAAGRRTAFYDREDVQSIATRNGADWEKPVGTVALYAGLGAVTLSLSCGVDGGPVCKTPGIVGWSLLAGGGVLQLVGAHRHTRSLMLLYLAPPRQSPF